MITSHPNTTIAIKGQAKELNCTARGERPIIIRWEKGDMVIDPDRVMRYAIATKDNGDEVVSTLKVRAQPQTLEPCEGVGSPLHCICTQRKKAESGSSVAHHKAPPWSRSFPFSTQEPQPSFSPESHCAFFLTIPVITVGPYSPPSFLEPVGSILLPGTLVQGPRAWPGFDLKPQTMRQPSRWLSA